MEEIASRTTDGGTTLVLKRRKSDRFAGSKYEYFVTERGSNSRVGQYEGSKVDGMNQLRATKRQYESAANSNRGSGGGMGGGMGLDLFGGGGGGSPTLPGFGMQDDDEDEDDEMSQFPWF